MKQLSIAKRLPKLFGGKRSTSDREDDHSKEPAITAVEQVSRVEEQPSTISSSTTGKSSFASTLSKRLSHQTSGHSESKKKSTKAAPVAFDAGAAIQTPAPPPIPAKEGRRTTANVPAVALEAKGAAQTAEPKDQRRTFNIAPVSFIADALRDVKRTTNAPVVAAFSGVESKSSKASSIEPSLASVENLDDFSLRRILDKRLFHANAGWGETLAVVRIVPPAASQLASLTKVLTQKEDRRKKELALALTRTPEFALHAIVSNTSNVVAASWSAPLRSLLAVRELKRGLVVLQFQGGKERKIAPVNESERAWLFYIISRVCREHAGTEPTILTLSNLRSYPISEELINARCPFLLRVVLPEKQATNTRKTSTISPIKTKTDVSFAAAEWFEDLQTGLEDEEAVAESFRKLLQAKRNSLLVTSEEATMLDTAVKPKNDKESPEATIIRVQAELVQLEKDTLAELRAWESGQGPSLKGKSLVDLDHGRKGDPIASLIAHLESVDQSLTDLEKWMQDHDASVATMTFVARKIDTEVKRLRDEFAAKEKLAGHLGELLEDVSAEDERVLNDLSTLLPTVEREVEGFQKAQPTVECILRACRAVAAVRGRGGGDSKLASRKERFVRASAQCESVGAKLGDFLQSRIEYYYRFERTEAREAHGRLVMYAEVLGSIQALSPSAVKEVVSKYEREASGFIRADLARILSEPYFANPSPAAIDAVARVPDSALEPAVDSVRFERETALKEVHMPGAETRRRLMMRLRAMVEEEEAFCAAMEPFKSAICLGLVMDAIMALLASKINLCPLTVAAPVLGDMEAYSAHLSANGKAEHAQQVTEKVVKPLQVVIARYASVQFGAYLDSSRKAATASGATSINSNVFVRKYASVVDRFWAAGRGVLTYENIKTAPQCFGIRLLTEACLRSIGEAASPFVRFENASLIEVALKLRPDLSEDLDGFVDVGKAVQMYMKDAAEALVDASPFCALFELALASEEDETAVTASRLESALMPLNQAGALERVLNQTIALVDSKMTAPRLRGPLLSAARDLVMDAYWRLSEDAAEDLGIAIKPSATTVRDTWNKFIIA